MLSVAVKKTKLDNKNNAAVGKKLTEDMVANMNFREFAETVSHEWVTDRRANASVSEMPHLSPAASVSGPTPRNKFMSRDVNLGHWVLSRRDRRRHIRFSTVLYTDQAHLFRPKDIGDCTNFCGLPADKRKQLYRAYMELVCYVLWVDSPDKSFLNEIQRATLENAWQDPERDQRYSLQRLLMFFDVSMQK